MLKVYVEANSFEGPLLMELAANIPVARLIPALVKELELPQTDLMGGPLVYTLSHPGGKVLPAGMTLRAAGIQSQMYLILASAIPTEATPMEPGTATVAGASTPQIPLTPPAALPVFASQAAQSGTISRDEAFYSDQTMANPQLVPLSDPHDAYNWSAPSTSLSATPAPKRNRTRRTVLVLGAALLGTAGAGVGYAAFRMLNTPNRALQTAPSTAQKGLPMAGATPARPFTPKNATSLLVFKGHQQIVHTVAWSPDGTLLASGASDKQLLTWNQQAQVQITRKEGNTIHAVVWSPDSTMLAEANGNQVVFLNAHTGAVKARSTHTHTSTVTTLNWSPKQPLQLVSGGNDKRAVVWNAQTFRPQVTFTLHTTGLLASSWASDSQTIATGSQGGVVRIWKAQNAQQAHDPYVDGAAVSMNALAFHPTQQLLAAGGADGVLRLWQNGLVCQMHQQNICQDAPQRFNGHTQAIRTLAWSPDGRFLATAGNDKQLLIWNPTQSQAPLLKIQEPAAILALAWSPDGKKIASASGGNVTIWALA